MRNHLYIKHIRCWALIFSACLTLLLALSIAVGAAGAQEPVVRSLLFYSPTCPHCHQVITQDLPPLVDRYGEQLQILAVDVQTEMGNRLFADVAQHYGVPQDEMYVPMLFVGSEVLVGSREIPERFPGIIENGLASGGIGWPKVPSLLDALREQGYSEEELAAGSGANGETEANLAEAAAASENVSLAQRFTQDTLGNSVSVVVLLGMLAGVAWVGRNVFVSEQAPEPWPSWVTPVLLAVGLMVAVYMSFVEVTGTAAVCGPMGDCNTVQQSAYADLFGLIPVGVLGVVGFVLIGIVWLTYRRGPDEWQQISALTLFGLTAFAALFSIYLTFLEPFVIGASCAWCLTSAVVSMLLLWDVHPHALAALKDKPISELQME